LASFLDIKNIRELEDLVIEAIYLKIVSGKLDQKRKVFEVDFATSRDIRPGQLDAMIETLNNWFLFFFFFFPIKRIELLSIYFIYY